MSGRWLIANKDVFTRDLVRDYCKVYDALAEQDGRFTATGTISHGVLRELLGEAMRKGVFWRLKDTAHHLFRTPYGEASTPASACPEADWGGEGQGVELWQYSSGKSPGGFMQQNPVEALLDWCIGYAFHECVKLKEDAFQRQHYTNRLLQMRGRVSDCEGLLTELEPLTEQTRESIGREMKRILRVLDHVRALLLRYLAGHGDNGHVARFLAAEEELVRRSFGRQWDDLLQALYGGSAARLYLLAASASLEGGRPEQALALVDKVVETGEEQAAAVEELRELAAQALALQSGS